MIDEATLLAVQQQMAQQAAFAQIPDVVKRVRAPCVVDRRPELTGAPSSLCTSTRRCLRTICRRSLPPTRVGGTASPSSFTQRPSGPRRRRSPHSSTMVRPGALILFNPLIIDMQTRSS
jgi:hypothetical protein